MASLTGSLFAGCATYRWGAGDRSIVGGYKLAAVPLFKNVTFEPGVEVLFTNHLIHEIERSKVLTVVPPAEAEVFLEGTITNIAYEKTAVKTSVELPDLSSNSSLTSEYRVAINMTLNLRRSADREIIWRGQFAGERFYNAPLITRAGVNTVNPLYNLSLRRQTIDAVADDMMLEAHDRITENF
jgi:hypothetical protein